MLRFAQKPGIATYPAVCRLTLADYINKLRVEHSVALIREHPEWTIDAIAAASGYPRKATYYSNFYKIYGLTPAQYRKEASAPLRQ